MNSKSWPWPYALSSWPPTHYVVLQHDYHRQLVYPISVCTICIASLSLDIIFINNSLNICNSIVHSSLVMQQIYTAISPLSFLLSLTGSIGIVILPSRPSRLAGCAHSSYSACIPHKPCQKGIPSCPTTYIVHVYLPILYGTIAFDMHVLYAYTYTMYVHVLVHVHVRT